MNPISSDPRPSRVWRCLRWLLLTPLVLATLVALAYAVENWRGERAWRRIQRELAAQGHPRDFAALVPAPVPDDQNLAMAPLLRPVLAFHREPDGELVWEDRPGQIRLSSVGHVSWTAGTKMPEDKSWFRGERVDLPAWQRYYRELAKQMSALKPPKPTGLDPVLAARYGLKIPTNAVSTTTNPVVAGFPQLRPLPPDLAARYGVGTNLTEAEFRNAFTFPVPPAPGTPAEDVLLALSLAGVELDALAAEAARRPLHRFPVQYLERPTWGILLPHLSQAKKLASVLQLRAVARLMVGQSDGAFADTLLAMRIAEMLRDEPFLISHLVRAAAWSLALQPVWEGLNDHRWKEPQLAEFARRLRATDLLVDVPRLFQGHLVTEIAPASAKEREDLAEMFRSGFTSRPDAGEIPPHQIELGAWLIRHGPAGWFYQNQVTAAETVQQELANFSAWNGNRGATNFAVKEPAPRYRVHPYRYIVDQFGIQMPLRRGVATLLRGQAQLHLTLTACALERYRLANGGHPAALTELVPRFLDRVPSDPMTGEPLRYVRAADGGFKLYSVGGDGMDNGGELEQRTDPPMDLKFTENGPGDWVWSTVAK